MSSRRMKPIEKIEPIMPIVPPPVQMPVMQPPMQMPEMCPDMEMPEMYPEMQMPEMMPMPCMPCNKCVPQETYIPNVRLATAYVPFQKLCTVYEPVDGLYHGTIFPELFSPYGAMEDMCDGKCKKRCRGDY